MKHQSQRWLVGVVIPAQNEEATIASCIRSVLNSLERANVEHWIVVVADHCTDRTVEYALSALGKSGMVLEMSVQSAGAARRAGVARVLNHWHERDLSTIWLANTDADTEVSPDWVSVQLGFANQGVTAVAGIVQLPMEGRPDVLEIYKSTYFAAADGTHTHVHGANLSVRADAYQDVGGWSELALAEDHCLWGRLRGRGWRVTSPVSSVVTTSARLEGRAKGGFADSLRSQVETLYASA